MFSKDLICLVIGIVIACVLIFLTCFYSMNKNFDLSYKKNLQIQANFVSSYISDEKVRLYLEATSIADSSMMRHFFHDHTQQSYDNLVNYIEKKYEVNVSTIVDAKGIVLFGSEDLSAGYKVKSDFMLHALHGEAISDIVNFKKRGLCICAASPIIVNGEIIGALMIGDLIRTNHLVDKIKMLSGLDMTFFDKDTRVSTTIILDGQRAIGTKLENYDHIVEIVDKKDGL